MSAFNFGWLPILYNLLVSTTKVRQKTGAIEQFDEYTGNGGNFGTITLHGGNGTSGEDWGYGNGGNSGSIDLSGADCPALGVFGEPLPGGGSGGSITARGNGYGHGGSINLDSGVAFSGGSIDLSDSGVDIIAKYTGITTIQYREKGSIGITAGVGAKNGRNAMLWVKTGSFANATWSNGKRAITISPTTGTTTNHTTAAVSYETDDHLINITPAGTIAAYTYQLPHPAASIEGQIVTFSTSQIITAFTVSGQAGDTVRNAVTTLAAGAFVSYQRVGTVWCRVA